MRRALVLLLSLLTAVTAAGPAPATASASVEAPAPAEACEEPVELVTRVAGTDEHRTLERTVPTSAPVGLGACQGVRPGAQIRVPKGSGTNICTMNFIYRGRDAQGRTTTYVGTAGHCLLDTPSERSWRSPGTGPVAHDARGNRIGQFAYAALSADNRTDFALVRLDPGVRWNATMCAFGGPTGVNREETRTARLLRHFGHGTAVSLAAPGRTSVAQHGMPDTRRVLATGVVAPGDSGAGVIDGSGQAVGVVVTVGVHLQGTVGSPETGTVGITRIRPQLNRASRFLQPDMWLVRG